MTIKHGVVLGEVKLMLTQPNYKFLIEQLKTVLIVTRYHMIW